jgi:ribA/ribD-fused uncharacterized protein
MASGYPLIVNDVKILSAEALYQACRYPDYPEYQKEIFKEKSPMSAKMISKKYYKNSRADWESVRVEIMRWSLRVKLSQNFAKFGRLLETTYGKHIVEETPKEKFWGATKQDNEKLIGTNALGRLLMELRECYYSEHRYTLLTVQVPNIPNFKLYGKNIGAISEVEKFIQFIRKQGQNSKDKKSNKQKYIDEEYDDDVIRNEFPMNVGIPHGKVANPSDSSSLELFN